MKRITRLSLALMMFSLFSISYLVTSVSADMYNPPPNPSNDPRNTMKPESVDLNKQTLQLHKRITELEQQLNEERAKSAKQLNEERAKSEKQLKQQMARVEHKASLLQCLSSVYTAKVDAKLGEALDYCKIR